MSVRSRRLVRMVTENQDIMNTTHEDEDEDLEELRNCADKKLGQNIITHEDEGESDLDEVQNCAAEKLSQIIGNIFNDSDEIPESDHELRLPPRRVSESPESTSLFSGECSDDDPTYCPEKLLSCSSSSSNENYLITLQDLLGSEANTIIPTFNNIGSPQLGPSRQREEENYTCGHEIASVTLSDILDRVWGEVRTMSRWRTSKPSNWKKNIAKKRRADGLPYFTNNQKRSPKVPKSVNCKKCAFKCIDKLIENDREKLCRIYWNLDFLAKKNFIISHVTVQKPKRVVVERKRAVRPFTTKCYFYIGTEKIQVCQKFFCSTLAISHSVVNDAIKHRDDLGFYTRDDGRGKNTPPNKTPPEKVQEVVDHINSFPTMESHYARKQSKRRYLDSTLSISKMYQLYLEKNENNNPVSEITYRRIFATQFNYSFFVPKKDQCQTCNKYTSANQEDKINMETLCYAEHIQRKNACNSEKERDKLRAQTDKSFLSVSFDLQAILQIPCSQIGLLYYLRKLTVYNLTIYESALPNNAFCFNWSEIHGKKGSSEIGSILYHYLSNCISKDVTTVTLFSDTAGGQNRNQNIAAILLWTVNKVEHLQVIEQKFLESGHSYMEADSMHSSIENAKKHKDIFSMTDWQNIFKAARSKGVYKVGKKNIKKAPYHVKEFKYHEFYNLKQLSQTIIKNKTKDGNGNRVNWLKIKKLKFIKGENRILFNYDVSDHYLSFDVKDMQTSRKVTPQSTGRYSTRNIKRRGISNPNSVEPPPTPESGFSFPNLEKLYDEPMPISTAKKKDLITLCEKGIIPEEYHGWFHSLRAENDIIDRVPDVAVSESEPSDEEE